MDQVLSRPVTVPVEGLAKSFDLLLDLFAGGELGLHLVDVVVIVVLDGVQLDLDLFQDGGGFWAEVLGLISALKRGTIFAAAFSNSAFSRMARLFSGWPSYFRTMRGRSRVISSAQSSCSASVAPGVGHPSERGVGWRR
jgi:hypothetical protein